MTCHRPLLPTRSRTFSNDTSAVMVSLSLRWSFFSNRRLTSCVPAEVCGRCLSQKGSFLLSICSSLKSLHYSKKHEKSTKWIRLSIFIRILKSPCNGFQRRFPSRPSILKKKKNQSVRKSLSVRKTPSRARNNVNQKSGKVPIPRRLPSSRKITRVRRIHLKSKCGRENLRFD